MSLHRRTVSVHNNSVDDMLKRSGEDNNKGPLPMLKALSIQEDATCKWKADIVDIAKMLKGLSKIFIKYYQGVYKDNLLNYTKFIDHVNALSNVEKVEILKHQVHEIITLYATHKENIDKEYLIFMFDSEILIHPKPHSSTFIPLSDCYIEIVKKEDEGLINNIHGFIYTLIYLCSSQHTQEFLKIYNKYVIVGKPLSTSNIRTDTVSNSVEDVINKIGSKITINDPVLENKLSSLAEVFKSTLTSIAENSVSELEKEGVNVKNANGDIDIKLMASLVPRMLLNSNIQNSMNSALKKLGEHNVEQMVSEVMN